MNVRWNAVVEVVAFLFALGFLVALLDGCSPRGSEPPRPVYCAEESAYTAALVRCVDKAKTLEESKTCRRKVNADCGITETP